MENSSSLKKRWLDLLGEPSFAKADYPSVATKVEEIRLDGFEASLWKQATEPGHQQTLVT